jgi:hypothetical protein
LREKTVTFARCGTERQRAGSEPLSEISIGRVLKKAVAESEKSFVNVGR